MLEALWKWITSSKTRPYISDNYAQLSNRLEKALFTEDDKLIIACLDEISRRVRTRSKYSAMVLKAKSFLDTLYYKHTISAPEKDLPEQVSQPEVPKMPAVDGSDRLEDVQDTPRNSLLTSRINKPPSISAVTDSPSLPLLKFETTPDRACEISDNITDSPDVLEQARLEIVAKSRDLLIDHLSIGYRLKSRLKTANIYYLRELNGLSKAELVSMRGITENLLDEIVSALSAQGHLCAFEDKLKNDQPPLGDSSIPISSHLLPDTGGPESNDKNNSLPRPDYHSTSVGDDVSTLPDLDLDPFEADVHAKLEEFF